MIQTIADRVVAITLSRPKQRIDPAFGSTVRDLRQESLPPNGVSVVKTTLTVQVLGAILHAGCE